LHQFKTEKNQKHSLEIYQTNDFKRIKKPSKTVQDLTKKVNITKWNNKNKQTQ